MVKKNLIKSTTKKDTKAESKAKKKTTAKSTTNTITKKTAAKKNTTTAKKAQAKKTTSAKTKKRVSIKELIFKKFDTQQPQPAPQKTAKTESVLPEAPAFVSHNDPNEAERIKKLLFNKYSMDELIKAAKEDQAKASEMKTPKTAGKPSTPITEADKPLQASQPTACLTHATKPAAPTAPVQQLHACQEPPVKPINSGNDSDPVIRTMKLYIGCLVGLLLLVFIASFMNSGKYYLIPKDNAVEIRQGRFSPSGDKFFLVLHGLQLQDSSKQTYTFKEISPIIFNYYLDKADALLEVSTLPDFEDIKTYLNKSMIYSTTPQERQMAELRLNTIDRMILMYKADVAMSKNTLASLKSAAIHLKKADLLTNDTAQKALIQQKIVTVKERIKALKAQTASEQQP